MSAWKWFQILLHSKFCKIAEKLNFMAFRVNLKNSIFIWSTYLTKLLEEKNKQLKIIMKSIMAAQKCKKYMVSGSIEGFFISCSTKIKKKPILSTLLHLQDHTEENARIGGSGELFCLQMIYSISPKRVFQWKLNFEGLQNYKWQQKFCEANFEIIFRQKYFPRVPCF